MPEQELSQSSLLAGSLLGGLLGGGQGGGIAGGLIGGGFATAGAIRTQKQARRSRRRFRAQLRFAQQQGAEASRRVQESGSRQVFFKELFGEGTDFERVFRRQVEAQQAESGLFSSGQLAARQGALQASSNLQALRGEAAPGALQAALEPERLRQLAVQKNLPPGVAGPITSEGGNFRDLFRRTPEELAGGFVDFDEQGRPRTQTLANQISTLDSPQEQLRAQFAEALTQRAAQGPRQEEELRRRDVSSLLSRASAFAGGGGGSFTGQGQIALSSGQRFLAQRSGLGAGQTRSFLETAAGRSRLGGLIGNTLNARVRQAGFRVA